MGTSKAMLKSIRSEIHSNMRENGYTLSKLSELSGVNPGHLSEILNSNPPRAITIGQLDAMAMVFGQPPGWLYELYPEECISEDRISRPRLVPYLVRCAELGRQDCIEAVVSKLLEKPKSVSILFTVAEELFQNGKKASSVPFYQFVIETEKDSHSELFVISQYRLFRAVQGANAEDNWKAIIRFEPYRNRLSENLQLDALLQLANACYTLQKWKDVEKYADELRTLAIAVYQDQLRKKDIGKTEERLDTERHLVVYYGQSSLLKGIALTMQEEYEEAEKHVHEYTDLSWFELLDEIGYKEVKKFNVWGRANLYGLGLKKGNLILLSEYVDFLTEHPNEILPGMLTIIEAANQHGFCIDELLDHFSAHLSSFHDHQNPINLSQNFHFWDQKSEYDFRKGRTSQAINELLLCLDFSDKMAYYHGFKRCITKFWKHLPHASNEQKDRYQAILEGRV
ncbi:helix-turn-helix transcriptional regulator [Brevibacillus parabrevis]|uniref:helix-turn-helix domain-containing protein n=1 Tax=Brevibacillus parabrevis TaxID=54914 RepID=UPI0028D6DB57|nr:helix-turn-helix transcriptional regulator [Brevibacillus parabrevis]